MPINLTIALNINRLWKTVEWDSLLLMKYAEYECNYGLLICEQF